MRALFIDSGLMLGRNIGLAHVVSTVKATNKIKVLRPFSYLKANRFGEASDNISLGPAVAIINKHLIREIENFSPEIVCFSATSFTFNRSLRIAASLKLICPKMHFIWGGVHPTLLPEETIKNSLVDAICIGEGERALPEYINKLERRQEPNVDGIWYKDRSGQIVRNKLRAFEENLDALPFPDWDWFGVDDIFKRDPYDMPGSLSILSSRGCPYDCSFCSNSAIRESVPGRYYRVRGVDNVIAEIKYNEEKYDSRGFRNIHFADEIFGLDVKWLVEFCGKLKQEGLHKRFSWCCATRADMVSQKWSENVSEAGCRWVWLGIESGDDYIRQTVYKKNITKGDIVRAVTNLKNSKINFGFYLMVGCPEENMKSVFSSLKLIYKTKPATFHYMMYIPLPKTELSKSISAKMWVRDKELRDYWNTPRVVTRHLGFNKMNMIIWFIRILKIMWIFIEGIRMKGIKFALDTFCYFFSGQREVSLFSPYLLSDFEQKTIFKYYYLKKQ